MGYLHETLQECDSGKANVSRTITVAFVAWFQSYDPLIVFMLILCNLQSCTLHNSFTVYDIFMQFYRNVNEVKTMCRAEEWLSLLSWLPSYAPLIFFPKKILVHTITQQPFGIPLCNFQDNVRRIRMVVPPFLASKLCHFHYVFPNIIVHPITQ